MNVFVILLSVLTGAVLVMIWTVNMLLGKRIGIYGSNLVNHVVGAIGSGGIFLIVLLTGVAEKIRLEQLPWYALTGGLLGSVFVVLSNYTFPKTGVITSTILKLAGQFICALFIDMVVLHAALKPINILGAVVISFAVIFYHSDTGKVIE